ncbi:sodium:solute symporter [Thioclava sp. SK-1]|uniref:ATP-binding protein n=1 Tax=Thioclava sp. SK-1 TaxID=1889770 RepID=UPI000825B0C1|nr:ATP-binding protein [Thioclava sp. SK-1]OCX64519.1 sodium:solute symporter [Thioclava sp. SK-1]
MPFKILVTVCLAYVILLFVVAFLAERRALRGQTRFLHSPWVYTLSLSIYCTAWTFYGAVGYAARSGLEFLTIYLGPTLVFVGWWWVLRKLVRIGRAYRVTSIADLISSRFGKSNTLGVIVTLMAVAAATPYIALQLQSVTESFGAFVTPAPDDPVLPGQGPTALWIACGLTLFTILFGTRNLDANERHHGVVMAIALEAVVKLIALLAVGIFVVWGIADGPMDVLSRIDAAARPGWHLDPGRFAGLTFVSAAAVLTLPRMFQVLVVENVDERHLATASWAFPAYLLLMSIFVLPIAAIGLELLPADANPDLFVLTLPLGEERGNLALLAFLGGFSSATSMVIVVAIALATMVSNHIVTPLWLALRRGTEPDVRGLVLFSRRVSIAIVLAMGYGYYQLSGGSGALAEIGLIAFVGAAQVLPAMLGGIYWRGATHQGAQAGLVLGAAIWLYTLFLPSFGEAGLFTAALMEHGPYGLHWLRPQALFGIEGLDPLLHAIFWSFLLNTAAFLILSLISFPPPMERLQGVAFVNVFDQSHGSQNWQQTGAEPEDLLSMAQRILGAAPAQNFFQAQAQAQGKAGWLPDPTAQFLTALERKLAGSVGAATAHAMLAQLAQGARVSVEDLIAMAGEAAEIKEHSAQLETQSAELTRVASRLKEVNEKLTELSVQKDAFLGQISHELRTPMTSIRAFSEILMEPDLPEAMRVQYSEIIHEESRRLTRLLDDLLDLAVLEHRKVQLNITVANLHDLLNRAVQAASSTRPERSFKIERDFPAEHMPVFTDCDRLVQVFINLISNARKYCAAEPGVLRVELHRRGNMIDVDFIDNGQGIPTRSQALIFEKFSRLSDMSRAGGAGLGLAICREIMVNLGGEIAYLPGQGGAAFRVSLPLRSSISAPSPAETL